MAELELVETSLRDGNQCLWAALGIDTAKTLTIAPVMDRVGYRAIDFTTSTHMGVAVRYKREDPWERIRLMAAATPNTPLQFMSTGFRFITLGDREPGVHGARLPDARAQRHPPLLPRRPDERCRREHRLRAHGQATAAASTSIAALVFTLSPVHDDAHYVERARKLAACPDIDALYIKDPGGLLSPKRAQHADPGDQGANRCEAARAARPLHDRTTRELLYMDAPDYGIAALQCAVRRRGRRHLQPAGGTRRRRICGARPRRARRRRRAGAGRRDYFTRLAEAEGLPAGTAAGFRCGATCTTSCPAAWSARCAAISPRAASRISRARVIEELGRVRQELGWPIVMTPFSQIAADAGGHERDRSGALRGDSRRSDPLRDRPLRPAERADRRRRCMERIEALPRTRELRAEPPMAPLAELRRRLGGRLSRRGVPAARDDAGGPGRCDARRRSRRARLQPRGQAHHPAAR